MPVGARFSKPVQTGPGAHPAYCTLGTGSFLGVKSGRGVMLTPHPLLMPWSRKGRVVPLLPLWAVRPLQSLIACTRVHFTFTFVFYFETRIRYTSSQHTLAILLLGHGEVLSVFYILCQGIVLLKLLCFYTRTSV